MDLSRTLEEAGGIGRLLARSHGYSGGNWSSHNAYQADGNGNVTALVNRSGVLQASYRYEPFGRYLAGGGPLASANVMRFSSKPWVGHNGSATDGLLLLRLPVLRPPDPKVAKQRPHRGTRWAESVWHARK